jgi:hypothetical protein
MTMPPAALDLKPSSRRTWDQYDTPPWQVDALVDHVPAITGFVWEPCAGDGSLVARLLERRPTIEPILTVDIDPRKQAMVTADMTLGQSWRDLMNTYGRPEWVVTNPPFSDAYAILQLALSVATVGVAFLSRLSFVEPTKQRGPWLVEHPHDQRIVLERWSYTGNGRTDASTTEWLLYVKDWRILTPPFGISAFGYRPRS